MLGERMYIAPAQQNPARRRYIKAVPPSGTDIAINSCAAHFSCPAAQSVPFTLFGDRTTSFENVLVEKPVSYTHLTLPTICSV